MKAHSLIFVTIVTDAVHSKCISLVAVAASKGEAEPERKETRTKVDEDRKHEYP